MKILLTNDDGYNAPGILALYEALKSDHKVILIAPDREKSAVGHGITLNEPLRINKINVSGNSPGYAIAGTPADCVKLGLFEFFKTKPDLVISGINPGSNTGININYSGTVGAAREAALNGISSMAVSVKRGGTLDFKGMSGFIAGLVDKTCDYNLPPGTFLNINAPDIPINKTHGIRITRQAPDNLSTQFKKCLDPRNGTYYWYSNINQMASKPDTDVAALSQGYISITPIQCDITDYKAMSKLEAFGLF